MTEQEKNLLLKEAKQRFPIGTKYKCAQSPNISGIKCIIDETFYTNIRYNFCKNNSIDAVDYGYIYYDGKWAEVISKPESNLKVDDLVEGEVYHVTYSSGKEFINLSKGKNQIGYYISIDGKTLEKSGHCDGAKTCRLATPEEKQWLEACIKAGKFIEKSEALKQEFKPVIGTIYHVKDNSLNLEWLVQALTLNNRKSIVSNHLIYENLDCLSITNNDFKTDIEFTFEYYIGNRIITEAIFSDREWFNKCKQANKFIPKEEALKSEPKYDCEVVHCTTQEEWDFVSNKLNYTKNTPDKWSIYKENSCLNINKDLRSEFAYYLKENAKIYSFQEWYNKFGHKPDFKPEFESGKWYKINNCWYAKFNMIHGQGTYWQYSESITFQGVYNKLSDNIKMSSIKDGLSVILLTDLNEIQQYLPDNHPDKIKVMKEENLIGRYLKALVDYPNGISLANKGDYFIINDSINCTLIKDNTSGWLYHLRNDISQDFELMPEGFTPETYDYSNNNLRVTTEDYKKASENYFPGRDSIDKYPVTSKEAFKNKTESLFSKDFNNPLNKVLELPKSSKKKTKQLIY